MKIKKILSLVMALAMALSLSVTALGASTQSADSLTHEAQYTGTTSVPVINLAVSNVDNALAFNPYKLAVKVDATGAPDSTATGGTTMNDQFITREITITNKTNVPLKMTGELTVTASVTSAAPSTAKPAALTNKSIAATETEKKLYVYADFYAYDDEYANIPELTKTAAAAQRLVAATSGTAVYHAKTARVTLQADENGAAADGENFVYVKVNGEATPSPTTPWGEYDKVDVSLTFTFQSEPNYAKYAVVDKNDTSTFEVHPVYSSQDVKEDKSSNTSDLCQGVAKKVVGGVVCYIVPDSGKKITAVKFYDKAGTTAITTVKATTTNSKDPSAPWSFTMPEDNVVMEVTIS